MIRIGDSVRQLSCSSAVVQSAGKCDEGIVAVLVEPAVGEVGVNGLRHIDEGVVVVVHYHEVLSIVGQETRVEVVFELPSAFDICFCHQVAVEHQIEGQRVLSLRFEQFHVYLSGCGLVAVDDR